jgi:lipid-binding SYLF domain-containing protein
MGRHAEASTDADLKASIYSYSLSKGMFAGASLEGSVITADEEANALYWGKAALPDFNLGLPATKAEIQPLLKELAKLAARGSQGK